MRQGVIKLTEQGEGNVTPQLLLGIMSDTIYQALQSGDFGSPTCASICASLNLLGKLGWIEVRAKDDLPSGQSNLNTEEPPSFFDMFHDRKEGGDGPGNL